MVVATSARTRPTQCVAQVVGHADQLSEIAEALGLEDALRPGVGFDRTAAEQIVDFRTFGDWINAFVEQHFVLRDGADQIEPLATLQKVEMRIDIAFLGWVVARKDAGDFDFQVANWKCISQP